MALFKDEIEEFGIVWAGVSKDKRELVKDVNLPCFDVWFAIRNDTISELEKLAQKMDETQGGCTATVNGTEKLNVVVDIVGDAGSVSDGKSYDISAGTKMGECAVPVGAFSAITGFNWSYFSRSIKARHVNKILQEILKKDRMESIALIAELNMSFSEDGSRIVNAKEIQDALDSIPSEEDTFLVVPDGGKGSPMNECKDDSQLGMEYCPMLRKTIFEMFLELTELSHRISSQNFLKAWPVLGESIKKYITHFKNQKELFVKIYNTIKER